MGFWDLHLFNKAMLGKQGWWLITRPESLCARVLKGRYFHDSDFLGSSQKKHASHTWRSIMAGKEVLERGLIKRIGNGASTDIWRDRWIPRHFNARPITPSQGQQVTLVSELLLDSGHWDEELIKAIFLPIDARAILCIPVRPQEEDWWAWEPEKFGYYTVKSAYRKISLSYQAATPPGASNDETWSRIWSLNVPPKVRVFWWRLLHEFLLAYQRYSEPSSY